MATTNQLGRPADRKELIKGSLRRQIVDGQLLPGSQLPTRTEIEGLFQASPGTVQSALEELRSDGFVEVRGRQGTFVTAAPPHLTDYALVFPCSQEDRFGGWVRFWTALTNEAQALQRTGARLINCYFAVDEHQDSADFRELTQRVRDHRLAGIVFASPTFLIEGTTILEEPGIPRVSIGGQAEGDGMSHVTPQNFHFWERAFAHLAANGRRRVALINPPHEKCFLDEVLSIGRKHGIEVPSHWMQGVHVTAPELARNLVGLLFHEGQCTRPEALVIADDNLVEHASAGLADAGISVPDQLEVVAHCNFPWPTPSTFPMTRLGFDAREVLLTCLAVIDEQRQKGSPPYHYSVEARFESELSSGGQTASVARLSSAGSTDFTGEKL